MIAHGTLPWLIGTLLAVAALWPHEHLHAIVARALGVNAGVHWSGLNPHTRLFGLIGMTGIVTSLAPHLITAWFLRPAAPLPVGPRPSRAGLFVGWVGARRCEGGP